MSKKFMILWAIVFLVIVGGLIFFYSNENCYKFPDKLKNCERYSCNYKHPITSDLIKREILGISNDKCYYIEDMPNNAIMSCKYTQDLRIAVAEYYRDVNLGASEKIETTIDSDNSQKVYRINGKKVINPLQEALDNGECEISGY